jgi:hypothetical protein
VVALISAGAASWSNAQGLRIGLGLGAEGRNFPSDRLMVTE